MGGVLSSIGGLFGAGQASSAAKQAANISGQATDKSIALQKYMYDTTRGDYAPYREAGTNALNNMTGANQNAFFNDPSLKWRYDQGLNAMNQTAAAKGGLQSGAALKAGQNYGQNMASTEYQNAFNRWANIANLGMGAAANTAGAGSNYANSASSLYQNDAANKGNAKLSSANAWNSAYQGAGNALGDIATMFFGG